MAGRPINLFMWSYQVSYRAQVQYLTRRVLEELGATVEAEVLLVGARSPNSDNYNSICIEPEDGKWRVSIFNGLLDTIESTYRNHDLQNMCFTDTASMRDKPEWIRRSSVRKCISNAIKSFDTTENVTSFCGNVRRVGDYYVSPIIQIPNSIFLQFPPLPLVSEAKGYRSLIHAAIDAVLDEATQELEAPEPGRYDSMRSEEEIVQIAAKNFMHTPGASIIAEQYYRTDLFNDINLVSSLMYEGTKGVGNLILVSPKNEAIEFMVKFIKPVSFKEPRWVRKILQMASTGIGIIADSRYIYGLGKLDNTHNPDNQDVFIVTFVDHYHWELHCGNKALIRSHYSKPRLPQEPFNKSAFLANYQRMFPSSTYQNGLHLWQLMLTQIRQNHGSMIVVAEDADKEASRLSMQGTCINPILLSESLLESVSGIDGTILLDTSGYCHAIGLILDGEATAQCTPSRGSRYNSGVRYVQAGKNNRLAIVVSDDHTVDIIPEIRPLVSRSRIEYHISNLEIATLDNYHNSRNWLDEHRFYINEKQCCRLNTAIDRLDALPREVGLIYIGTQKFEVHPEMNESYLID
ncbi:hypothetical protein D6N97_12685 [Salmonella enterica]|uniref:DAC domain-containing protein n=1 Tax=Edwardsiella tarda TaxID=636 RepID=A0A2A7TXT4_EDWTA|nr:hypothetical protein [Edwardsiella tarda]EAQ7978026.1 hypothetical protein [Salmonella enterica]EHG9035604.1 hypothetical protein [Salmonella enterica subsp. diarizonae serovar 53:z10:-]EGC8466375.1 hypothetical protein [Salmonella enterica]EHG9339446.1 hypothetical protein [Salmonella enterica]EKS7701660.1 hypothetical protein [Salmonella enterica]